MTEVVHIKYGRELLEVHGDYEPGYSSSLYDPGESEYFDLDKVIYKGTDVTPLVTEMLSEQGYEDFVETVCKQVRDDIEERRLDRYDS